MPLTDFQRSVLALLARTRSPDSHLAGGAALHFAPNSLRYSNDLDFFHDSAERVARARTARTRAAATPQRRTVVSASQTSLWRSSSVK